MDENGLDPSSYPDVSLSMKMCAQRKAERRQRARRASLAICTQWSLAVNHQSLAFRALLYDVKNEAPEEEAGLDGSQAC